MRFRLPRGRSALVLGLAAALVIPTAVGAASSGRKLPAVAPPAVTAATGGQSSEIFLVQLEDGAQTFRNQAKSVGLKYTERFAYKRLFKGMSVRIGAQDVGKLAGIGSVANVYPARYFTLGPTAAADPELATAIQMTGADIAQASGLTGAGVQVAVMDTGIDVDHPDLGGDGVTGGAENGDSFPNSRITDGFDLVGDDYNADSTSAAFQPVPHPDAVPDDCNGHGTHVAGIVGADGDTPAEARGVAPGVTFGAYRVFGCDGSTTDEIMIAAMELALADGMDVLNMSIGDAFNNWAASPTAAASDALVDAGMVVVASIGNSGANGIYSAGAPGVGDKVIGVASYDNSHIQAPGFTITPDDTPIAHSDSCRARHTRSAEPTDVRNLPDQGVGGCRSCRRVPPNASREARPSRMAARPSPPGTSPATVALIRRGGPPAPAPACTFTVKAQNAEAAGAVAVVLYNHSPGALTPIVAATPQVGIPVVMLLQQHGQLIHNRLGDGTGLAHVAGIRHCTEPDGRPHLGLQLVRHGSDADDEARHRRAGRVDPLDVAARGRRVRHDQRNLDGFTACGGGCGSLPRGPSGHCSHRNPRHPAEQR